jgi:ABC-type phosphate transport system permease subunit
VFALCGVVYAVGVVTQYLVPGRRLKDAGVKTSTLFLAVLLAIVLFFLIPVVGAPIGFVLGVFLVETGRHRESGSAWRSTLHALKAVAMSIGIELVAGFLIVLIWLLGVWRLGIPT